MARVLFVIAGLYAMGGSLALSALTLTLPTWDRLPQIERVWWLTTAGFASSALFFAAYRLTRREGTTRAHEVGTPTAVTPTAPEARVMPDAPTTLEQMRTYIDLEMWELALDKANDILTRFATSQEAEVVARSINELRWKAEPKPPPSSASTAKERPKTDLRRMIQHVSTYMELEMWELAREKCRDIARIDPESAESSEAGRLLIEIDRKSVSSTTGSIVKP